MAEPNIISPCSGPQGVRPRPGLKPNSPQTAAGTRIEPPRSLAPASGAIPADTAAGDPPDEPPGVRSRFQGLRAGPHAADSVTSCRPNSGVFVRPKIKAPAFSQRSVISAWTGGANPVRLGPHDP